MDCRRLQIEITRNKPAAPTYSIELHMYVGQLPTPRLTGLTMPVVTPDMDKNYDCVVPLASNEARLVLHLYLVLSSYDLKIQDQSVPCILRRISKLWCVDVDIKAIHVKQRARIVTGRQEWSVSDNPP